MTRETIQIDEPEGYCCISLEDAVQNGEITYHPHLEEFRLYPAEGKRASYINYCPWCGESVISLRGLRCEKMFEYENLNDEEFDRFWPIIAKNLSKEETMRLIAEEKAR